jgi:hypothetical protein
MMGVLIITSLYVSKLVGGMLYMCIQMSKFIAWLLVRPQSGSSGEAAGANVRSIAYPGPEPGC